MPKGNRLNKKKDIEKVFQRGEKTNEEFLVLRWRPNNLDKSRFTFVVSKKVAKKAPVRNKIKRRLRAGIKKQLYAIKPGVDVLIIAKPGAEKEDSQRINGVLNRILQKTKLTKKDGTNTY